MNFYYVLCPTPSRVSESLMMSRGNVRGALVNDCE